MERITELIIKKQLESDEYYELIKTNKLDIDSLPLLEDTEEEISKIKSIKLYTKFNDKNFYKYNIRHFESIQFIHEFLFDEIYEWAGCLRNIDISKNNFTFFRHKMMKNGIDYFNNLDDISFDEIINKYAEYNYIHPFYEGNGRAGRIWLDKILFDRFGKVIDWEKIDKRQYINAIITIGNDPTHDKGLIELLKKNLVDFDNKDLNFIFRSIDASYRYEGMKNYNSNELYNNK